MLKRTYLHAANFMTERKVFRNEEELLNDQNFTGMQGDDASVTFLFSCPSSFTFIVFSSQPSNHPSTHDLVGPLLFRKL